MNIDGSLTHINTISGIGNGACHLSVDKPGLNLFTASYNGATVNVLPIKSDGSLDQPSFTFKNEGSGPNPER